jgi:hypothetical protein
VLSNCEFFSHPAVWAGLAASACRAVRTRPIVAARRAGARPIVAARRAGARPIVAARP